MEYKDKQIISVEDFCASNIIDDTKRSEGLKTPDDIERFDNIFYGPDKNTNYLDVYLPKNHNKKLPVIVSIHGGGWVYGNKDIMQFYCMSLAQKGFAVINFSYRLAPKYKHPTPFIDTNAVFCWVFDNAEKYGFGQTSGLLLAVPFILLFSYSKTHKNTQNQLNFQQNYFHLQKKNQKNQNQKLNSKQKNKQQFLQVQKQKKKN